MVNGLGMDCFWFDDWVVECQSGYISTSLILLCRQSWPIRGQVAEV